MGKQGQGKFKKTYPRNLWIISCITFKCHGRGAVILAFLHIAYFLGMRHKSLLLKNNNYTLSRTVNLLESCKGFF